MNPVFNLNITKRGTIKRYGRPGDKIQVKIKPETDKASLIISSETQGAEKHVRRHKEETI